MEPLRVAENILPASELEARASEVVEYLRARGRPMLIQRGKPAAVLISPEELGSLAQ